MSLLPDGDFGARVGSRLREGRIIWFTTVGKDGTPQPNPVWFLWNGADELLTYNRADSVRVTHVAARPHVSLNLDGNGQGGDIVVLTGTARRDDDRPPAHENADYVAKYGDAMARVSAGLERFGAEYPVALVIEIAKIRGH
jgi:PPOX class probable F420-dependent enzyme